MPTYADTAVKVFGSHQYGAPVLSGQAGALQAVMQACLVDGYGTRSIDSITVTDGVATAVMSAGNVPEQYSVVQIIGATAPVSLPTTVRVQTTTATTFTFPAADVANGGVSGTLTCRQAPAGWQRQYTASTTSVWRPTDVAARGAVLRLDDSGATDGRVTGYMSMTDAHTGTDPFPTTTQLAGGGYWPKSGSAGTTARNWRLVADERFFYFWVVPNASSSVTSQGMVWYFGEYVPGASVDAYCIALNAGAQSYVTSSSGSIPDASLSSSSTAGWAPRDITGLGSSQTVQQYAEWRLFNTTSMHSGAGGGGYPDPHTAALQTSRVALDTSAKGGVRGRLPGMLHIAQDVGYLLATGDVIDGAGDMQGRKLLALRVGVPATQTQNGSTTGYGCVLIDVTGPWR